MAADIVQRIDHRTALCPCGAEPRPGSRFCSADCEPTHIGAHTDPAGPGTPLATPMRWRPDLITAVDDSHRTLLRTFRRGPYQATIFEYPEVPGRLHLRLDNGYRFVGTDTDPVYNLKPVWQRLERELAEDR
ncbi:hypothetical protein [Paractinoplanes toevensis]|uniref:Uncharacterized protein n=1 Tax=Paractinoplanes toevensis TaxID=571911 RepID=A0A920BQM9_9ACTN|nr:hypothetical protein [Actinoplanes toevensis]GIM97245.1 hypothetical protein Ato02nite_090380 [Actinoplanes toevensis]